MIETFGLTHIALEVIDLDRSLLFYQRVFGVQVMYRTDKFLQFQTPGAKDIIVLQKAGEVSHRNNGILHFGFRLVKLVEINVLMNEIKTAGGRIKEAGEFVKGEPYVFFYDPDGYEIEIWFENIPPELSFFN